jgi:hypothetical protein
MTRDRILTLVGALALSGACVARTVFPAPQLPWWLREDVRIEGPLQLSLRVTLEREQIRICRTLTNGSASNMVIGRFSATGDDFGQLLTFMLDASGYPIAEGSRLGHGAFQAPPEIRSLDDLQTLAPGAHVSNCDFLALPRRPSHLWVVSTYRPQLEANEFTSTLPMPNVVISRDYGAVRSNLCEISRRTIRCGGDPDIAHPPPQ